MHSVCILIYTSMYLYSYLSRHGISGLAARGDWQDFKVRLRMTIKSISTSITPVSPYTCRHSLTMDFKAVTERVARWTLRSRSSELTHAHQGQDRVNSEIQSETVIQRVWRCTWRPWWSKLGDPLGGRDRVDSEMHSEMWSSKFRDPLAAGYGRGRLDDYLEVVYPEAVDGTCGSCTDTLHRLIDSKTWEFDEVTLSLKLLCRTGWWQSKLKLHSGVNSKSRQWRDYRQSQVYAVLGVYCTRR